MKKDDISMLVAVVVIAVTMSYIISSALFKSSSSTNTVPVVEALNSSLPDAYGDPAYTAIFNSKAIDPAQLTQIGNQNNSKPFRGSQ